MMSLEKVKMSQSDLVANTVIGSRKPSISGNGRRASYRFVIDDKVTIPLSQLPASRRASLQASALQQFTEKLKEKSANASSNPSTNKLSGGSSEKILEVEESSDIDDEEDEAIRKKMFGTNKLGSELVDGSSEVLEKRNSSASDNPEGLTRRQLAKTRNKLTPNQIKEITEIFSVFDTDGSGSMEIDEIRVVLLALGFQYSGDEVEEMVSEFFDVLPEDIDDISLCLDEFLELMSDLIKKRLDAKSLLTSFNLYDIELKGRITGKDIRRVAKEVEFPLSDFELQRILAAVGSNDEITLEQWIFLHSTQS